jgi:hypothetical protein
MAALITRTLGLVLIIHVLALLPERLVQFVVDVNRTMPRAIIPALIPSLAPLAIGGLLVWIPGRVASLVTGKHDVAVPDELPALVFCGIGLYFSIQAVLDLSYYWMWHELTLDIGFVAPMDDPKNKAGLFTALLQLGFGVVLMFGARGLANLWLKLRSAGTP